MNCPQCTGQMSEIKYEGVSITTCGSCGGEFLGSEDIWHIINTREQALDGDIRAQVADWKPVFGVPDAENRRTLTCPACRGSMQVINYSGDSGIFVDRCDSCGGLWLDYLELEKVQALLEQWADESPAQIQALASQLEAANREMHEQTRFNFRSSRFSFVNALLSKLLDAA